MDKARQKLRNHWAKGFTNLDPEWTHWWIDGEGYCLGVIDGGNLSAAVDIVEDNWEEYASIKSSKAKVIDGDLIRKNRNNNEVSNRDKSRKIYEEAQSET